MGVDLSGYLLLGPFFRSLHRTGLLVTFCVTATISELQTYGFILTNFDFRSNAPKVKGMCEQLGDGTMRIQRWID